MSYRANRMLKETKPLGDVNAHLELTRLGGGVIFRERLCWAIRAVWRS